MELFFDLVFVFAVTQLSRYLLHHHTIVGALQTLIMFLAVRWAWNHTAWATNWLDPTRPPIRVKTPLVIPGAPNEVWSADFMSDALDPKRSLFAPST